MSNQSSRNRAFFAAMLSLLLLLTLCFSGAKCYAVAATAESASSASVIITAKVTNTSTDHSKPTAYVPDDGHDEDEIPWWLEILQGLLVLTIAFGVLFAITAVLMKIKESLQDRLFFKKYGIKRNGPEHKEILRRIELERMLNSSHHDGK